MRVESTICQVSDSFVNVTNDREAYPKRWIAMLVQVNCEKKTATRLGKIGYETYIPTQQEVCQWSDRKKKFDRLIMPSLISKDKIECGDLIKNECMNSYVDSYKQLVLGQVDSNNSEMDTIRDLASITLYNFPERSVDFLKSLSLLTDDESITSTLLFETLLSIFRSRTDIAVSSTSEIDTKFLAVDDTDIILELIKIAQNCRCYEIVSDFTDVIRKRIYQI